MAIGAIARLIAPTVAREVAEGGFHAAVGQVVGRAASRGLASVTGQRLAGRVAGERVATALASKTGQKYVSRYAARETRQTLGGENEQAKPAPMPTTPVSQEVNPNLIATPDTPIGRRQRQQGWQDNGVMGSRFGSGGGGWWTAASITDPMKAGYDWRNLSDTSVARGPVEWNMAGKGMGRRAVGRARGFVEGYRGAQGEQEQVQPGPLPPDEIAKINANITSTWPTTPNAPTNPSQNVTQISRSEAFNFGSDSDLGYGSRNPVGPFSTYPRPPRSKPYTGGTSFT